MTTRSPSHAGSWYSDHASSLSKQLQSWLDAVPDPLDDVGPLPRLGARVIIAPYIPLFLPSPPISNPPNYLLPDMPDTPTPVPPPHGPTNTSIYHNGKPSSPSADTKLTCEFNNSKRIFLLGPSHHLYLPTLALPISSLKTYTTPLGPLALDTSTLTTLRDTKEFSVLPLDADEDEHSLEMHLPYIYHCLSLAHPSTSPIEEGRGWPTLVPILVGSTSAAAERKYGKMLAPYLADGENVFIISSDFCHWGLRFQYTYYLPSRTDASPAGNSSSVSSEPSSSEVDLTKAFSLTPKHHS
ncbi:MAG: hypothetical protein Q9179_007880, partial [Wetmoreana sp. 5 TL-2023]